MRVEWILVLVALVAGTAVPVQFAVNAQLRGAVGGPITAATISFFVGTIALLVAVLVAREGAPNLAGLSGAPWWAWAGGFLGAFYVAASIVLTPRLGAATTIGFIISGQVLASIILDQFGLLNLPVHPITLPRLGGAVLVVAGAIIVLRS
ncbi:DMT family transporter [soil metagenome]